MIITLPLLGAACDLANKTPSFSDSLTVAHADSDVDYDSDADSDSDADAESELSDCSDVDEVDECEIEEVDLANMPPLVTSNDDAFFAGLC